MTGEHKNEIAMNKSTPYPRRPVTSKRLADWGLALPLAPEKSAQDAMPIWTPEAYPGMPVLKAVPVPPGTSGAFNITDYDGLLTIHPVPDGRHDVIVIAEGPRRYRLAVEAGVLQQGPCRLHFPIPCGPSAKAQAAAIEAFTFFLRHRRLPAPKRRDAVRQQRYADALRAWDARKRGQTHRQIATSLFGPWVHDAWRGHQHDSLRMRVRRLLDTASTFIKDEGYKRLLKK